MQGIFGEFANDFVMLPKTSCSTNHPKQPRFSNYHSYRVFSEINLHTLPGNGPLGPGNMPNIPNFPTVRPAVDDHDKLANSKLLLKNKIKENARQVTFLTGNLEI